MTRANKSSQATGAKAPILDGVGDSLLLGFVAASFPAPVPELWRWAIKIEFHALVAIFQE